MSKVICDVCGTAFAETADQCPICGTAKSEATRSVTGSEGEGSGYAYVKGGRFSQANVRKHNSGKRDLPRTAEEEKPRKQPKREPVQEVADEEPKERPERRRRKAETSEPENEQPSNIGLIIVVVVLLLAIMSLCAYIAIRFIDLNNSKNSTTAPTDGPGTSDFVEIPCEGISIQGLTEYTFNSLSDQLWLDIECQPANTTDLLNWNYDSTVVNVAQNGNQWLITPVGPGETVVEVTCGDYSDTLNVICNLTDIPCNGITIEGASSHTFTSLNEQLLLNVVCDPVFTTDALTWTYDEAVVTVSQDGEQWVVTPVGPGSTTVTVTCGQYSASVSIVCDLDAGFVLELSKNDITLRYYGETAKVYSGSVDASKITWTSDDESVATVKNGVITAVGAGKCNVYGVYGTQMVTCIVRCTKDVVEPVKTDFYLAHQYKTGEPATDVTITVGEKLSFSIRKADGTKVSEGVTFYVSDEAYLTVDGNGRIIGLQATVGTDKIVYLYAEYEGVVYECKVRIKNP